MGVRLLPGPHSCFHRTAASTADCLSAERGPIPRGGAIFRLTNFDVRHTYGMAYTDPEKEKAYRKAYLVKYREAHREELNAKKRAYSKSHYDFYHSKTVPVRRFSEQEQSIKKRNVVYGKRARDEFNREISKIKSKPCMDCAGTFPPCAMDFDHLDPTTKLANIGNMRGRAWAKVLAEIGKCDLVCSNCHRVRTDQRRQAKRAGIDRA